MNIVDLVIAVVLVFAFLRGFSRGVFNRILSAVTSLGAMIGAYFLTAPVVRLLERQFKLLTVTCQWAEGFFLFLPVHNKVYDPGALSGFLAGIKSNQWLAPLQSILEKRFVAAYEAMGPNVTWDQMLGSILGQILLSSVVFWIVAMILILAAKIITGGIIPREPGTTLERFLGGCLEAGISFIWLSLIAGTLYTLMGYEPLAFLREAASSSWMMKPLLAVYQSLSALILSRLRTI